MKIPAKTIRPYSSVRESGDNCPALKHFFKCDEGSGNVITDHIGGCVYDSSAGGKTATWSGHGVSWDTAYADAPIPLLSGQFCAIEQTNRVLVVAAFDVTSPSTSEYVRVSIGDVNGNLSYTVPAGIGMAGGGPHAVIGVGTNGTSTNTRRACYRTDAEGPEVGVGAANYNGSAFITHNSHIHSSAAGTAGGFLLTYTGDTSNSFVFLNATTGADINATDYTHGATYKDLTTDPPNTYDPVGGPHRDNEFQLPCVWDKNPDTGLVDGSTHMRPNPCVRFSNIRLYGYAIFVFQSALPANWDIGARWMINQWRAGEKFVYPGFVGLA